MSHINISITKGKDQSFVKIKIAKDGYLQEKLLVMIYQHFNSTSLSQSHTCLQQFN